MTTTNQFCNDHKEPADFWALAGVQLGTENQVISTSIVAGCQNNLYRHPMKIFSEATLAPKTTPSER